MLAVMLERPSIALPGHVVVEEVADASRRAVRAFLAIEPDKASLSAWLSGPYREATCFGPRRSENAHPHTPSGAHQATPTKVTDLVMTSKSIVIGALTAAQLGIDDLLKLLPSVVRVVPAHDVYGNRGFIPVDGARIRLADRLLALLVADYLTRPGDFDPGVPSTVLRIRSTDPWTGANAYRGATCLARGA
jgi:hypothetical protein